MVEFFIRTNCTNVILYVCIGGGRTMIEREFEGKKLKELRKLHSLTAKQLGEKLGVSMHTVYAYEKGERTPRTHFISKLSSYFDVPTDYFFSSRHFEFAGTVASMERFLKNDIMTLYGVELTESEKQELIEHFSHILERKRPYYYEDRTE